MDDQLNLGRLSPEYVGFGPVRVGLGTEQEIPEGVHLIHGDVPRKQVVPVIIGHATRSLLHHQIEVVLGIESVRLGTLHQAEQQGGSLHTVHGVGEKPVAPSDRERTYRIFRSPVVQHGKSMAAVTNKALPIGVEIVEGLAELALGRDDGSHPIHEIPQLGKRLLSCGAPLLNECIVIQFAS